MPLRAGEARWGRGQETAGEDPYLTSQYAVGYVSGMQGDPAVGDGYLKTMVTCKHFFGFNLGTTLAYGGGFSQGQGFNALISDQDMADTFLPAFRACITEAKGASVMCSYNAVSKPTAPLHLFRLCTPLQVCLKSLCAPGQRHPFVREQVAAAGHPARRVGPRRSRRLRLRRSERHREPSLPEDARLPRGAGSEAALQDGGDRLRVLVQRHGLRRIPDCRAAGDGKPPRYRCIWVAFFSRRQRYRCGQAAAGITSGTDLDCGSVYKDSMASALGSGAVSQAELDRSLQRLFLNRMRTGEFE